MALKGKKIYASEITIGVVDQASWNRSYEPYILVDHSSLCEPALLSIATAKDLKAALTRALKRAEA